MQESPPKTRTWTGSATSCGRMGVKDFSKRRSAERRATGRNLRGCSTPCVVVTELSRLSRSVRDLIGLMEGIHKNKAEVKSLKEPWLDTTTPQGRLLFTVFSGLSEFERDLIRQRTIEGLEAARARGHKGGHPTLDRKKVELALKMYDSKTCTVAEITAATGVSKSALYAYLKDRRR